MFVAGWIVDSSGNYNVAFPVAGGFIMFSGVIIFFLYLIRLCSRFCHYCCATHSYCHRQPRHYSDRSKNGKNAAEWINGPPAADHAVL